MNSNNNDNEIVYDYDFKEKLLGKKVYDSNNRKNESIRNILLAKEEKNYVDSQNDYVKKGSYLSEKTNQGHIEDYKVVHNMFEEIFKGKNNDDKIDRDVKDIMNSFWTTYKFFLQIEYPNIFTPGGINKLSEDGPLEKNIDFTVSKVSGGYPPPC